MGLSGGIGYVCVKVNKESTHRQWFCSGCTCLWW